MARYCNVCNAEIEEGGNTNNSVDPTPTSVNTGTVDNPSTGLFISLICGFGLCFVIIICHYISKHFRKIRRI